MSRGPWRAATLATFALLACATPAIAKTPAGCAREFTPQRGQDGKDVIWVPTEDAMVDRMLEVARVSAMDRVYDLGSGDGKIPLAAAKQLGASAVGIEYDAALTRLAQCLVEAAGLQQRVTMRQGDIFAEDFSSATVVTLYLLPELNLRLRPTLLAMAPGTRVVSYSFTMGEWEADEFVDSKDGSAYLWIVPANIDGAWTFRADDRGPEFALTLRQTFQYVSGHAADHERVRGKLAGSHVDLQFSADGVPVRVLGTVIGERIDAVVTRGSTLARYTGTRGSGRPLR